MLPRRLKFDYASDLLDEIALEGLDGITLISLFERLKYRVNFIIDVETSKEFIWKLLVQLSDIRFYCLPETRDDLTEELLSCNSPAERTALAAFEENLYPIHPVSNPLDNGSCADYETRRDVTTEVNQLNLPDFLREWGSRVVIVATLKRRLMALGVSHSDVSPDMEAVFPNRVDFIYLERIGRSRIRGVACSGPGSLLAIGKDSKRVFYHVKRLLQLGLVEKYEDSSTSSGLLRVILVRFRMYRVAEDEIDNFSRLLVRELNRRPLKIMPYTDVRPLAPNFNAKRLNKIFQTSQLKERFEILKSVPYSEIFPNASPEEALRKTGDEKVVKCVRLVEAAANKEEDPDMDDDSMVDNVYEDREFHYNVPLLTHVYRSILAAGSRGLSNVEILKKMDASCPTMKAIMKKLIKDKLVDYKFRQIGRTRTRMFVISKKEMQKPVVQRVQKKLMETDTVSNLPVPVEVGEIVIDEDLKELPALQDVANDPRKMQRIAIVLTTIRNKKIIQAPDLQLIIREDEERRNLKDKMDRRSLSRILVQLVQENLIKLIVKTTEAGADVKFYADPSYNPDDTVYENIPEELVEDPVACMKSVVMETEMDMTAWSRVQDEDVADGVNTLDSKKMYAPKFLRLSVLHDLVYYLVRGYTGIISYDRDYLLDCLQENYSLDDYLKAELPTLYSDHVSCYMFIPPLSPVHERIPGWCTVGEIILNSPLSLYTKLVKLKDANAELQSYLDHPIRCHYTLRSLPSHLRHGLVSHRQVYHFLQDLRRLCYMGLVKFGHRCNKRNLYLETFYVCMRGCVIDTTTSRFGYFQIDPNETYDVIPFDFNTKQDVKDYWVKLFNICLETKLGHKSEAEKENSHIREEKKDILIECLKPVTFSEAVEQDTGIMPGDQLGAGGVDSCLFSFLRSNWVGSPLAAKTVPLPKSNTPLKKTITKQHMVRKRKRKPGAPKPRKPTLDEFDIQATQLMRTLRVQWSRDEDNICLMIKAAICYICPNLRQSARISWADMREALWRHVPTANDKTQLAVRRRIQFLIKKLGKDQLVASVTQVLKNMPEVAEQFDCSEIVSQLKPTAPNAKDLHIILRNTFHSLVDFMVGRFINNGHIVNLQELHLPDTMEELGEMYNLKEPIRPKITVNQVKEDSIRAILLSSMLTSNDKSAVATQLFEVYRQYDENILKGAVRKLHRQKVITLKKLLRSTDTAKYLPVRNSPYQFSFGFCFLMSSKYRQSVYHDAYLELNRLLCNTPGETVELNLGNCGPSAFVLASLGHVDLTASTPEQFVVIDTELIPTRVSTRIMERYNELINQSESDSRPVMKRLNADDDLDDVYGDDDDEPAAKRQLVCTDPSEGDVAEVRVAKAVKRRFDEGDPSEQSFGFRNARLALFTLREVATKEMEASINSRHPVDFFVVSSSKVLCTINGTLSQFGLNDAKVVKRVLSKISGRSDTIGKILDEKLTIEKICSTSEALATEDLVSVLSFISECGPVGASVQDLLYYCERDELRDAVHLLEEAGLVYRVGVEETRFVSQKHISAWAIHSFKMTRLNREKIKPTDLSQPGSSSSSSAVTEHSTPIQIIMRPWLRIDGSVNRRVLDKLLGTLLGHIMLYPGISLAALTQQFSSGMSPVWTKEIVEALVDIGCVTRFIVHRQKASLFSKGFTRVSDGYTGFKADDEILLESSIDAIIKLGQFVGNKTYNRDVLELPAPAPRKSCNKT